LPDKFWGDYVLTYTFLINKIPMKILGWKTPFEVLHSTPPTYDSLRTNGCLCYATITKPHKDKFAPRSIRCVFIGYPPGQKGYRLYNLETREVFCSRDVIFKETVFPFKKGVQVSPQPTKHWPELENVEEEIFFECHVQNDRSGVMPNTPDDSHNELPEEHLSDIPSPNSSSSSQTSIPTSSQHSQPTIQTRRLARTSTQPAWLKDFVTSKHKASMASSFKPPVYPLFKDQDFECYPEEYVGSLAHVLASLEPTNYS
jgi:hypothetical protein